MGQLVANNNSKAQ
jgi:hypothetical protein